MGMVMGWWTSGTTSRTAGKGCASPETLKIESRRGRKWIWLTRFFSPLTIRLTPFSCISFGRVGDEGVVVVLAGVVDGRDGETVEDLRRRRGMVDVHICSWREGQASEGVQRFIHVLPNSCPIMIYARNSCSSGKASAPGTIWTCVFTECIGLGWRKHIHMPPIRLKLLPPLEAKTRLRHVPRRLFYLRDACSPHRLS